jgi:alkylation response protein AidB-like acyl-CoA dehydrogenase
MSYELNEHQIKMREHTIDYINKHIVKNVNRFEDDGEIRAEDIKALMDSGVWDIVLNSEKDWVTKVTILNELAKSSPSFASMFTDLIFSKAIVSKQFAGNFYASAFVEEDAGSDLTRIQTEAVKTKDTWVLAGEKWFVANAELADTFLVLAKISGEEFSIFEVPKNAEGVIIQEQKQMGMRGLKLSKVIFNQISLSPSSLILSLDSSFEALNQANTFVKLTIASLSIGISESALKESLERARSRKQFGQSIGDYQAIQFKIAEITVGINASKSLLYLAAQKLDRNEEMETEASMAKLYSTEVANKAVNHAVQIYGTHGLLEDSIVSKLYRSQRLTEIFGQTSEMQRIDIAKYVINNIGVNQKEVNYGLSI